MNSFFCLSFNKFKYGKTSNLNILKISKSYLLIAEVSPIMFP